MRGFPMRRPAWVVSSAGGFRRRFCAVGDHLTRHTRSRRDAGFACAGIDGAGPLQHCLFRAAGLVRAGNDAARGYLPTECCGHGRRADRLWRRDGRRHLRSGGWVPAEPRLHLRHAFCGGGNLSPDWFCCHSFKGRQDSAVSKRIDGTDGERAMKITEVRTRVVQWEGETVPLPPHFCTNPMDLVAFRAASMGNFAFHSWLLVEIFTDNGLVGLGNAALSPAVTKTLIDTYLRPLLVGADPWDIEFLWQQMYRRT